MWKEFTIVQREAKFRTGCVCSCNVVYKRRLQVAYVPPVLSVVQRKVERSTFYVFHSLIVWIACLLSRITLEQTRAFFTTNLNCYLDQNTICFGGATLVCKEHWTWKVFRNPFLSALRILFGDNTLLMFTFWTLATPLIFLLFLVRFEVNPCTLGDDLLGNSHPKRLFQKSILHTHARTHC